MQPKTISTLQYYVNKVCSIVTTSMNRSFDEQLSREHFVIRVSAITVDGIWGTHPYSEELVSFFNLQHVISIHQEIELDPKNPDHSKMIADHEQKTGKKLEGDLKLKSPSKSNDPLKVIEKPIESPVSDEAETGDATFIDIEQLELLAEKSKKSFDAQQKFT